MLVSLLSPEHRPRQSPILASKHKQPSSLRETTLPWCCRACHAHDPAIAPLPTRPHPMIPWTQTCSTESNFHGHYHAQQTTRSYSGDPGWLANGRRLECNDFFCEHPRSRCLALASPLVTPRPIIDRHSHDHRCWLGRLALGPGSWTSLLHQFGLRYRLQVVCLANGPHFFVINLASLSSCSF